MLLCMAFVLSFSRPIAAKTLFLELPWQRSQAVEALEPGRSINQESDKASKVNGFVESSTAHNRTTRNVHPCISGIVREYDWCRGRWIVKVQCNRRHPACNHVITKHRIPKCQTVHGFRNATFVNKCPSLPLDCQCAS